jgi:hypothetical protein
VKKDIVLFALSWREGGICVAGKDLKTKKWIRPVTAAGPVPADQTAGFNLLDIVEIEIGKSLPVHHQSENYALNSKTWAKKTAISKTDIQPYLDSPANLWDTKDSKGQDSITPQEIIKAGIQRSLYLISLDEMTVSTEEKEYNGKKSKKLYGIFIYNGVNYKLRITDPHFNSLYTSPGTVVIKNPVICLSLGGVFEINGKCYKLIAGVI